MRLLENFVVINHIIISYGHAAKKGKSEVRKLIQKLYLPRSDT